MSINSVTISGNLTADSVLHQSQDKQSVLSFGIASDEPVKDTNGQFHNYTNYIDCAMFGKRAESLAKILKKGVKVAVQGKLHYSTWKQENDTRSKVSVYASNIDLFNKREPELADEDYKF